MKKVGEHVKMVEKLEGLDMVVGVWEDVLESDLVVEHFLKNLISHFYDLLVLLYLSNKRLVLFMPIL